jgi:hypothetical protein
MANETNEYTEAYAAALGVATDSKITHDTLVAFRTEINFLRQEVEGLRVTVAELTTIALGDEKFDKWFDTRFGDSLTTLVEEQVRETIEDVVDDSYIEERIDLGNYNANQQTTSTPTLLHARLSSPTRSKTRLRRLSTTPSTALKFNSYVRENHHGIQKRINHTHIR